MVSKRSSGNHSDVGAFVAGAEPIDPGQPARQIDIPVEARSFAFSLDNDLLKLVTLTPVPHGITVTVSYATDTVLDRDRSLIATGDAVSIVADALGLVIEWREPLFPWLGWPVVKRKRRF